MSEGDGSDEQTTASDARGYEAFRASLRQASPERVHRRQQFKEYFEHPKGKIEAVTLAAVIIYAGLTYRLMEISQGQLSETVAQRKLTVAQIRAQMVRGENAVVKYDAGDKPIDKSNLITSLSHLSISPQWINDGATPALRVTDLVAVRTVARRNATVFPDASDCPVISQETIDQSIRAKGETVEHNRGFKQFPVGVTAEDLKNAYTGRSLIIVQTAVYYRDIDYPETPIHHSYWCESFSPQNYFNGLPAFLELDSSSD